MTVTLTSEDIERDDDYDFIFLIFFLHFFFLYFLLFFSYLLFLLLFICLSSLLHLSILRVFSSSSSLDFKNCVGLCVLQDEVKIQKVRRAYEDAISDYGSTEPGEDASHDTCTDLKITG